MILLLLVVKKRRERNKTPEKQVMHSTVAHHPPTNTQPDPKQSSAAPGQTPLSLFTKHNILWYGLSLRQARVSCLGYVLP